jgi:hypothetical protein
MRRLTKRDYTVIADVLNFVIVGENPFMEEGSLPEDQITDDELKAVLRKVEEREA